MSTEIIQEQVSQEKIATVDLPKVQLLRLIEALIMGSNEVVSARDIRVVFDEVNKIASESTTQNRFETISAEELNKFVDILNKEYEEKSHPFRIQKIAGGFLFVTLPEYAIWLGKLYNERARRKLSSTAVETLAIIAYRQPISKTEIEFIRGVNCDYILKTLLEKNIVSIVGRASTPGRALLYGTTSEFLKQFGLNEISELPKPREIEDMISEADREMEKYILKEEQNELHFGEKKIEPVDENTRAPHIPRKKSILQMTSEEIAEVKKERLSRFKKEEKPEIKKIEEEINLYPKVEVDFKPSAEIKIDEEEIVETETKKEKTEIINIEEEIINEENKYEQKGWSKWKNRITTAFRKLFG